MVTIAVSVQERATAKRQRQMWLTISKSKVR